MKRLTMLIALALVGGAAMQAQSAMTGSPAMSGSPSTTGSANSMMAPTQAAPSTSMMSATMTADPAVGNQLRFAASTGMKVIFTNLMAAEESAAKVPTVLFFAADWCPYCQADLKDINANGSRLGSTTIIVLNYDKVAELKTKYGITAQDTFVQIDARGNRLAVWNGGGVDGILSHLVTKM